MSLSLAGICYFHPKDMKASLSRHQSHRPSTLRAVLRLSGLLVAGLLWLTSALPIAIASLLGRRARFRLITFLTAPFCRTVAFFIGMRISTEGSPDENTRVFVANHVSWLDILLVGSAVSGVFVSRHDLKNWPGIGIFARLAGTVFIDRTSLKSAVESSSAIVERAGEDIRVAFFPEGKASEGDDVLPFKPFLFGAIVEKGFAVQPVTLMYTHIGKTPVAVEDRDLLYWYSSDQDFLAHAWQILKLPSVQARAVFRPSQSPPENPDRNSLRAFVEDLRESTRTGIPVWDSNEAD